MKSLLNKLSEYILVYDKIGNIKFCNSNFLTKLGYKIEEVCELHLKNLLIDRDVSIDSFYVNRCESEISTCFNSKDNEKIKVSGQISKDKFNEEEVYFFIGKEEKIYKLADLEMLLENINMGVFIKDKYGKYIYGNKICADLAGVKKDEFIGSYDKQYFCENYEDDYFIEKHINKKPRLFEELIDVDGDKLWYETYRAPIYNGDSLEYVITTTKNINVEKRLRDEFNKNYNLIADIKDNSKDSSFNLYDTLNLIGNEILNCFNASGLSIALYDKDMKALIPFVNLGEAKKNLLHTKFVHISDEAVKDALSNNTYSGLKSREEIAKDCSEIMKYINDVNYLGVYSIKLDNEYMGTLNISYGNEKIPKYNQDDFMGVLCDKIAMIIKNHRLSEELKKENEMRTATEKELEQYLNTAVDLVGIIGRDGYFKSVNSNWSKVLGWETNELLNIHMSKLFHPEELSSVTGFVSLEEIPTDVKRRNLRFLCKNNEYVHLDWSCKYIFEKEEFIVTVKDITNQKKMEEEKRKLEEAIQLESVKNEFFANISHEFKTPLNIILGTMQLIKKNIEQDNLSAEILNKHTNIIRQNSYRLLRLVNNLIDISRIDIGYYKLNLSNQNIVKIIEDITLSVADYVENRDIDLVFDTNIEEVIMACDPDKIERVILNILSNAIKYTPKGGCIDVKLETESERVVVSIKDNGIGIPKEKLEVIFDRFGQVNSTLSRMCEGSGIGLSLVKSILNLHGGDIKVFSEVGEGSEFIFEIPIRVLEESPIINEISNSDYHIEKCNIEFSDIYS